MLRVSWKMGKWRKTFDMPYLAGFDSSSYDFDDAELSPSAKDKVRKYARDYAQGAVSGYSTVHLNGHTVNFEREEETFIFVPIWFVWWAGISAALFIITFIGSII